MDKGKRGLHFDISLWMVVSAVTVLVVIVVMVTMSHFQRQRQQAQALFVEKGFTLVRSFEAALSGQAVEEEKYFQMQKLLMGIAQQPDIDYIIVTDKEGSIIADSDPSMISQKYGLDLDITKILASREINWRQAANPDGADTFEVYRGFFPQQLYGVDEIPAQENMYGDLVVYVGFNMDKIEKAAALDRRNTVILMLILVLIGSSAIISLFLVQAYRLTRSTLSRMQVFSDTLVKNMPIGLVAFDEAGKIISCNEKARDMLKEFAPDLSDAAFLPAPLKALLAELPQISGLVERDVELTEPGGEKRRWEALAAGLIENESPAGKILLLRDVTQIREMEKEVAKSRHLMSLSSLAAGVAHEIRNPLSSIKGFAVYLKERLQVDSEDKKTADIIVEEVERLNRVITQLIEFARPMELKKEKSFISSLVEHALKLIDDQARKNNISVKTSLEADEPSIEVDPDKVKQVLLNIFLNALDAMKNGGNLEVALLPESDNLRLVISDTGKGIEQKDLPRIYDPYFTSKPAGTGLGLAVVQKIMEAHGGKIAVESIAGQGTNVSLYFPR